MNQQIKYNVDIVLCIDATGSMAPVINRVKSNALKFYQDMQNNMTEKGKTIDQLRIRTIAFRDFYADVPIMAFSASEFLKLPDQNDQFSVFVNNIVANGGGDEPENGLEALAVAIKSKWQAQGDKKRQIIVIWADSSAHPLENSLGMRSYAHYPKDIPANFDELTDLWEGNEFVNQSSKRLIMYAPETYPWSNIANNWNNTIHFASQAGQGLTEIEYSTIIDTIANSI